MTKTFDDSRYGPGPDTTRPGSHWVKIIEAVASDKRVSREEAAELIVAMYKPQYHAAIRESAKL